MDYEETLAFLYEKLERGQSGLLTAGSRKVRATPPFLLPALFPAPETEKLSEFLSGVPEDPPPYLILLIQAGAAALGYVEQGEIALHKVITTYMVRQKQGKAQHKHLNQKGKSRLGSRIRLRNTVTFFERINTKLNQWGETDYVEHIFYSSSIPLWNLLHESAVSCPFAKHDKRLRPLDINIHTPNFEELQRANTYLLSSQLIEEAL